MDKNKRGNYTRKQTGRWNDYNDNEIILSKKIIPKRVSLERVIDLLKKNPQDIVLKLSDKVFCFDNYLSSIEMGDQLIYKLIELIEKAFDCNSLRINLNTIASKFLESNLFQEHIYRILLTKKSLSYDLNTIQSVTNICCKIIDKFPLLTDKIAKIKERLENLIKLKIQDPNLTNIFDTKLVRLEEIGLSQIEKRRNFKTFKNIDHDEQYTPNDFTEMSIVPTLNDILFDQTTFLRKNITNEAFKSVHHYLDIHFRLLREDYLLPLREGVSKFRSIIEEANATQNYNFRQRDLQLSNELKKKLNSIDSLTIFFEVSLNTVVYDQSGIAYQMKLMNKSKNLELSKKLMFGSLVCFSSDHFLRECLIGVISGRDIKQLEKGLVNVNFDYDTTDINNNTNNIPSLNKVYTMIESPAYFESYKHVLKALVSFKNYSDEDFPFKKHLIDCQNSFIEQPAYLKNAPFNFSGILDLNKKVPILRKPESKMCFLTNDLQWPSAEDMKLDDTQYEAVQLVLKNKIALIQGPPGTGKTFIGVKIMQLLIDNTNLWWNRPNQPKRPILMICYTNHALDQFLQSCIDECHLNRGIIRIGGRCISEKLEPFLMRSVKRNQRIDHHIFIQIQDTYSEIGSLKQAIESKEEFLTKTSNHNILSLDMLIDFQDKIVYCNPIFDELISFTEFQWLKWLGFFENYTETSNESDEILSQINIQNLSINDPQINDEQTVEIEKEFEKLNNERILDDYDLLENDVHLAIENFFKKDLFYKELISQEDIETYHNQMSQSDFSASEPEWKIAGEIKNNQNRPQTSLERFINNKIKKLVDLRDFKQNKFKTNKPIWSLDHEERIFYYRSWLYDTNNFCKKEMQNLQKSFKKSIQKLEELKLQRDMSIMKNAMVIAMTTTGSSRYHNVLKDIGPRIVIVEEAAEVFEAHIVSALSKNCEHLILIGDHVQLKPNPSVYKLAKTYKLDVSLFERLINNNIKRVMLNTQHRMKPEISCLMKHFYDEKIEDHTSTKSFPNIIGLNKSIFFLNHNNLESRLEDGTSKLNNFEADFITQFCVYLRKNKYDESRITVLSMYIAQMKTIKRRLNNAGLTQLLVTTVDNYQGEENDIIILSLVRSNKDEKIGFLATDNRVCVALSRARLAFYCIGNLDLMSRKSDKWLKINDHMKTAGNFGPEILLTCGTHTYNDILASKPEHFQQRIDGGCQLQCDFRLRCGHMCGLKCHTFDKMHESYLCIKECSKKIRDCEHLCKQECSSKHECIKCPVKVKKTIKECQHDITFRCDKTPLKSDCNKPCTKTLENCGHKCNKLCKMDCYPCETKVSVKRNCSLHSGNINIFCSDKNKIWSFQNGCNEICTQLLDCEHICNNACSNCSGGYIHENCNQVCNRILYCGHQCTIPCAMQCRPCQKKCQNMCPHSKCQQKCSEPCIPCMEKCDYKCEHMSCTKLCNEVCDRKPCNEPCLNKIKKCGHQCIGLCGEPCPKLCRICDRTNDAFDIFFGYEEEEDAKFVLLKDCGHIIESSGMDSYIAANSQESQSIIKLPVCPKCSTPIRFTLRYLNYVKTQLKAIEEIKKKQYGDKKKNEIKKNELLSEIIEQNRLSDREPEIFNNKFYALLQLILKQNEFSSNDLKEHINSWRLYLRLQKFELTLKQNKLDENQREHLNFEMKKLKHLFIDEDFTKKIYTHSEQRVKEISYESERLYFLLNLFLIENKKTVSSEVDLQKVSDLITDLKEILINKVQKCDPNVQKIVTDKFTELKKLTNSELTAQEKQEVLKAMGLNKGHWYKCSNGHVYCIGECGGAMEKSKCPECKEVIGGTNHTLEASNSLASEMDGAQYAAWSETANNMRNWQIE